MLESLPTWVHYVCAGIFGAILGSFANVCIVRIPEGESVIGPRSHCRSCGRRLSWQENIPFVSFVLLRGRCCGCGRRIPFQYPLVEAICVGLSVFAWWHFHDPLHYVVYFCLLIVPLVVVSFIDLRWRVIPDVISFPGIAVGFAVHMLLKNQGSYGMAAATSLLGAILGGGSLFLVAVAYEKLKKREGLGGGDVKLMAMLGAFFGWQSALFILLISSLLGTVIGLLFILIFRRDMKYPIPFGPFLALAGLLQLFYGHELVNWYLNLFH